LHVQEERRFPTADCGGGRLEKRPSAESTPERVMRPFTAAPFRDLLAETLARNTTHAVLDVG
jgi:hypothetical protein